MRTTNANKFPEIEDPERARARRRVEAMRLGVVPDVRDGVGGSLSPPIQRAATRTLEFTGNGRGGLQAFVGEYGSGKTHLLESIRSLAMQRGFVTARAVLDPKECKPSNPKRVYRRIATSIAYPDGSRQRGLVPLLERALRSDRVREHFLVDESVEPRRALESGAHLYLTPALRYLAELKGVRDGPPRRRAQNLLVRWLSGDPTISNRTIGVELRQLTGSRGQLFSLKDYRPWARIYGYLLSGIARLSRLAGYGGLAVFVDEAEFHTLLDAENRDFSVEFFQALAWAAKSGRGLPFGSSRLDGGGMGLLKDLPPCYEGSSNLYVAFAFTPAGDCRDVLERVVPRHWCREVEPMKPDELPTLADHIIADYLEAEPSTRVRKEVLRQLRDLVGQLADTGYLGSPRDTSRFVVDVMDRARHGSIEEELERLRERYKDNRWGW